MDRTRSSRSRLFLGSAGFALAAALVVAPQEGRGQAFNASATVTSGDASRVFSPGSSDEVITVFTPTAVIDWTPQQDNFGNALTFLPEGNTAFFQDAPGQGGFAVLNRILPSANGNIVAFDGRVVSRLQDAAGNFTPGGFVAFYSPTGILVGSTAVFDVGQLMLTTLDVDPFSFDAFFTQGGALNMSGPSDSTARVEIQAGARVNAPAEESFFIVAAPQVIMGGNAQVNGSTAYIAGTGVLLSYSNGLFDIVIPQGTDVANAIEHTGTTGGPASTGAGDNHVIYGVARAGTNPISLLFGGNLGFDPAVSATIENGDIILAANYDVSGTNVAGGDVTDPDASYFGGNETGAQAGNISIMPGTFSSRLTAVGTGRVQANANTGGIGFGDDVTLVSRIEASLLASAGNTLSVAGNARVDASNQGEITGSFELPPQLNAIGGVAVISATSGGTISIAGNALVQANALAGADLVNGIGGSATGGDAEIVSDTGTVSIGGSALVFASASGFETGSMVAGGTYTGGTAEILAQNGGALTIGADAIVEASANAAVLSGPGAQAVRATTGGTAQIGTAGTGGSIDIAGSAFVDASAFGRNGGSAAGVPGIVSGGSANLFVAADGTIDIGGDVQLGATARGHNNTGGGQGGLARGGQAVIQSGGISIGIGGGAVLNSTATGGDGGSGAGIRGGNAVGGLSSIDASIGTIDVGPVTLDASAFGGAGGVGGNATAGRTQVLSLGSSVVTLGAATMFSRGVGGDALEVTGNGGRGDGGEAEIATNTGGTIVVTGDTTLVSDGLGGDGRNGGAATSGLAGVYAVTGSIAIGGDLTGSAAAFGGDATLGFGGQGGNAAGGAAFLQADGNATDGASITVGGTTNLNADGTGGTGGQGDGGAIAAGRGGTGRGGLFDGTAGSGGVFAIAGRDRGSIALGDVRISANGIGGNGGGGGAGQTGGQAGNGFGGTAQAGTFTGGGDGSIGLGTANFGDVTVFATGTGGAGGAGPAGQGRGGNGTGGAGFFIANESAVTAGAVQVFVGASGGAGGAGGDGTSGQASVLVSGGGSMTLASLSSGGGGQGGDGTSGNGGRGEGGSTIVQNAGQFSVTGDVSVATNGHGGASTGGTGGAGQGGTAALQGLGGDANIGGLTLIHAFGFGGEARSAGQRGGGGFGGTVTVNVSGGATVDLGTADIQAGGIGGLGGIGGDGAGGQSLVNIATGGQVTSGSLLAGASGSGGEGTSGSGGRGDGGDAAIDYAGQLSVTGDATVIANGNGGAGTGGAGGAGQGGDAAIRGTSGNAGVGGTLLVHANGSGGQALAAAQDAGNGTGGTALASVTGGAIMDLGAAQISSDGRGGSGAAAVGGDGTGGTASLTAAGAGSTINIAGFTPATAPTPGSPGPALLAAIGIGGGTNGGTGVGGSGDGGTTLLSASAGGSITLADDGPGGLVNYVMSRGFGGSSSVAGGRGGAGTGGATTAIADNGTLSVGGMVQSSFAEGGSSGNSGLSITGGDATGGTRTIIARNGGTLTGSLPGGGSGSQGGDGSGGGNGGDATGGLNQFIVDGGTAVLFGPNSFFSGPAGGSGAIGGDAIGGRVVIDFRNGANITLTANGDGPGLLRAGSEGNVARGGSGTTRGGDATADDVGISITGSSFSGTLVAYSHAHGGIAGTTGRGGDARAAGVSFLADNASINFGVGSQLGALAIGGAGATGGNAFGGATGVIFDNNSTLSVALDASGMSSLLISDEARGGTGTTRGGDATGGSAGFTLLNGSNAGVNQLTVSSLATSPGEAAAGGTAAVQASGAAGNFANLTVSAQAVTSGSGQATGGAVQVVSQNGADLDIGALTVTAGDRFAISALNGAMILGALEATASGNSVSDLVAIGGPVSVRNTADITVAGDLQVTTGQGGFIGGPSVVTPAAIITIDAGGTVSFAGDNDAQIGFGGAELTITSTELDITDGARIGAGTLNLNVRANGNQTVAGGDTDEAGYTLTQQEAERIDALDVRFGTSSDGSASDDLLIRDLTISGSADDGIRSLGIDAGIVRVEGIFAYVDAAATDSLSIFADRLEIVTPGGIGIVDADGGPTGNFTFEGGDFWMADAGTIAQLRADRNFAGRDDLLATAASGSDDPLGYLRAGNVLLDAGTSLLVRNTGSAGTPGGITVTGGLEILGNGSPIDVFAYGRRLNPDGSFVTGADFFALVNFNRAAVTYANAAEFNDCIINTPECAEVVEPPSSEFPVPPIVTSPTTLTGPLATAILGPSPVETNLLFGLDFPGLIQTAPMTEADLIDDPVTSGGDSALFGSTEQTEGSAAEECEVDLEGVDGEECDDR